MSHESQVKTWAETAQLSLAGFKAQIVEAAGFTVEQEVGDQLGRLANQVSVAEGQLGVFTRAANMLAQGVRPEQVVTALTRTVLRGADDGWSGRTNDNRRARHDGVLQATDQLLNLLGGE